MTDVRIMPYAALRDTRAIGLARIRIAEGAPLFAEVRPQCRQRVVMETTAWGVILADMAGHVADALSAEGVGPRAAL